MEYIIINKKINGEIKLVRVEGTEETAYGVMKSMLLNSLTELKDERIENVWLDLTEKAAYIGLLDEAETFELRLAKDWFSEESKNPKANEMPDDFGVSGDNLQSFLNDYVFTEEDKKEKERRIAITSEYASKFGEVYEEIQAYLAKTQSCYYEDSKRGLALSGPIPRNLAKAYLDSDKELSIEAFVDKNLGVALLVEASGMALEMALAA